MGSGVGSGTGLAPWAGAGLGISEALAAPCGTATPDWVLLVARSEGDGLGPAGNGVAAGWSGAGAVGVIAACCWGCSLT